MTTTSGKLAAAAVVVAAITAIVLLRFAQPSVQPAADVTTRTDSGSARSAASMPAHDRPMIERLVPKSPPHALAKSTFTVSASTNEPGRVVAEVKAAAVGGDVTAMRILGETLDRCAHADMQDDKELEAAAAKFSLNMEYMSKKGMVPVMEGETDPARAGAKMAASMKQLRDSCTQISRDDIDASHDWLRKAADAGDARARWPLAGDLVKQMKDPDLLVEDRERMRSELMDLLQANIADGVCTSNELNLFMQQSHDPLIVYIYGSILMRRGIAAIGAQPPENQQSELAALTRQERVFAAAVPEEQFPAAEATRDYIAANYCNNDRSF